MTEAAANHTTKPAAHNAAHRHKGVLSGIRVLDFTWKTVGPWAPRLLTHYGAEVIHVERAGGWDDHRFAAHRSLTTDAPEPKNAAICGPPVLARDQRRPSGDCHWTGTWPASPTPAATKPEPAAPSSVTADGALGSPKTGLHVGPPSV